MTSRKKPKKGKGEQEASGNFISEWFGNRVHPTVSRNEQGLKDQQDKKCPFLSDTTRELRICVKRPESLGVCTISSRSNGERQDWLVCPFRSLSSPFLVQLAKALFALPKGIEPLVLPAPALAKDDIRKDIQDKIAAGIPCIIYLQAKLAGEVSLPATPNSPELAFDFTLVEVVKQENGINLGRYGLLEIQTMDFHGTYKHAVKNLTDALRLHVGDFPEVLELKQRWLSDGVEGPNIANVFKRTFYQTVLKFQIARDKTCAGCMLTIPTSVWDSWQRHLGSPELKGDGNGLYSLVAPGKSLDFEVSGTWICVFDIDASSKIYPNPIVIKKLIRTDAKALIAYALDVVPQKMIASGETSSTVYRIIRERLTILWPGVFKARAE